jgi:hypothetical protein
MKKKLKSKKVEPSPHTQFAELRQELVDIESGKPLSLTGKPLARKTRGTFIVGKLSNNKARLLYCLREKIADVASNAKANVLFAKAGYSTLEKSGKTLVMSIPAEIMCTVMQLESLWSAVDTLLWIEVISASGNVACSKTRFVLLQDWRIEMHLPVAK